MLLPCLWKSCAQFARFKRTGHLSRRGAKSLSWQVFQSFIPSHVIHSWYKDVEGVSQLWYNMCHWRVIHCHMVSQGYIDSSLWQGCYFQHWHLHVSSLISWLQLIRNSLQAKTGIELGRLQRANSEVKSPCFRIEDFAEVHEMIILINLSIV